MRSSRLLPTSLVLSAFCVAGSVLGVGVLAGGGAPERGQDTTQDAPRATTTTSAPVRTDAAVGGSDQLTEGRLTEASVADPFVLRAEGRYWLYGTNTAGANVPVLSSADGRHWVEHGDAFPALPDGAVSGEGLVWAPSVATIGGRYVLYATVFDEVSDEPCIAVATSDRPDGPYLPAEDWRLECGRGAGGVIDASPLRDADGNWWVLFKNEGSPTVTNALWSARLSADGLSTVGSSTPLLWPDQDWEDGVVEGPSMVAVEDGYLLVYSAAAWDASAYSTGLAWCETVTGRCRKLGLGPVLASGWGGDGPGGAEVFADASGGLWLVYHQRDPGVTGRGQARRPHLIALDELCAAVACQES